MMDNEAVYEDLARLYSTSTEEEKQKEIKRLSDAYHGRVEKFKKENRTRWILTFVGFAFAFLFVICLLFYRRLEDANIETIGIILILSLVCAAFHMFVNISIFGWLIQKIIAEDRSLDDIKKHIRAIENSNKYKNK